MARAGRPLFSLASGALLALMRPWHGDGFGRLLTTWFAFLSMQEGLGYLIVAPVLRAGDTGAALAELNAPWIAYAASVAVRWPGCSGWRADVPSKGWN